MTPGGCWRVSAVASQYPQTNGEDGRIAWDGGMAADVYRTHAVVPCRSLAGNPAPLNVAEGRLWLLVMVALVVVLGRW